MITVYLHKLEGGFKVLYRVHFYAEKFESHDEADGGLDDIGTLLLLPQLFELRDELLPHCREPETEQHKESAFFQIWLIFVFFLLMFLHAYKGGCTLLRTCVNTRPDQIHFTNSVLRFYF